MRLTYWYSTLSKRFSLFLLHLFVSSSATGVRGWKSDPCLFDLYRTLSERTFLFDKDVSVDGGGGEGRSLVCMAEDTTSRRYPFGLSAHSL